MKQDLLWQLQKKYQNGGYALVADKSSRVLAFAEELDRLYKIIDQKHIDDSNKVVMFIPPPHVKHVFSVSLSVRTH